MSYFLSVNCSYAYSTTFYFAASVSLPGTSDVYGLWPAIWTMGNLGRAGYGGTLESMWPYSYDTCDIGTLSNQTLNGVFSSSLVWVSFPDHLLMYH